MALKHVVTIGGGTGTFVVLSGLRSVPDVALTAIVTSADDGGSTGRLRDAYGFLPPGDARQALVALAEERDVMRELFAYRFSKGDIAGHNLGNLLITALTDILGSDERALREVSKILRVRGLVIPATEKPATLTALLQDGTQLYGEKSISATPEDTRARIKELTLAERLPLTDTAREAILLADSIILGPGCLYSSTIAALLPEGMQEVLKETNAKILYVTNLFSRAGETDGYTLKDHVEEITRYAGRAPDHIFVHDGAFTDEVLAWYAREKEFPLTDDLGDDARVVRLPLASVNVVPPIENDPVRRSLMRHDSSKLKEVLAPYL
jgi:uncharacterized cofD-like protein